jgi:integrase
MTPATLHTNWMAISPVEYSKKQPGTRYHPERKVWIGYKVDVRVDGKRPRLGPFATRREAEDVLDGLRRKRQYSKAGLRPPADATCPTVSRFLTARLEALETEAEKVRGRRVFQEFLESIASDPPVTEIRKSHFQTYINDKLAKGLKQSTVTREFAMVRAALNAADELFPEELEDFVPPRLVRKSKKRRRVVRHVITHQEMRAVADHLYRSRDPWSVRVGRMWEIAWYLGLRYGETLRLEKRRFNLAGRSLEANRWKTEDLTKFEELPDDLCDVIQRAIDDSPDDRFIFPHTIVYPNAFYDALRPAIEAAGLPYGRSRPEQVSFHSLRHSFVTRAAEVSDLATTGSLSAHSDGTMVAYYSHSSDAKRRELMRRLYKNMNGNEANEKEEKLIELLRYSIAKLQGAGSHYTSAEVEKKLAEILGESEPLDKNRTSAVGGQP